MKRFAATAAAAIAALALSGLTGSAAAGGGHDGHDNGDSHGQVQSQPSGGGGGGGGEAAKHQQKDEQKQTEQQQSAQPEQQQSSDHQKVYICHATGSQSNPYVLIHVDSHALKAHTSHQDGRDIVLGSSPGSCPAAATQSKPEQSKPAPAPEQKPQEQERVKPEHVKVFICHATGSQSNPYVLIHVDEHAVKAHEGHQDGRDIVLGQSIGSGCPTASSTPEQSVQTVTFCDMTSATTGKLETKSASEVVSHELNGTPEEARDIVPAFTFNGTSYSQLWDANGQAIFNAKCNASTPASSSDTDNDNDTSASDTDTDNDTGSVSSSSNTSNNTSAPVQSASAATPPAAPAAPAAPATPSTGAVAGATAAPAAPATPAASAPATSGVLGTTATLQVPKAAKRPAGGVLGALGRIATGTTLPFTGLKLWVVELIALALIGLGVATRLYARGRA